MTYPIAEAVVCVFTGTRVCVVCLMCSQVEEWTHAFKYYDTYVLVMCFCLFISSPGSNSHMYVRFQLFHCILAYFFLVYWNATLHRTEIKAYTLTFCFLSLFFVMFYFIEFTVICLFVNFKILVVLFPEIMFIHFFIFGFVLADPVVLIRCDLGFQIGPASVAYQNSVLES